MTAPLLQIEGLSVAAGGRAVLKDVSFSLAPGEVHGLVGESGAGKSTLVKVVLGLLPRTMAVTSGKVAFGGRDLFALPPAALRDLLGTEIALVPQDPLTALNPGRRIDGQLTDGLRLKRGLSRRAAEAKALTLLEEVHIRDPDRVMQAYPHELSGGMRQRVLIAAAFALDPKLIIADEPTTALDVTVQKQILRLIHGMQERHRTAVVFVTHDLGVVAQICDRVTVLYRGAVMEQGPTGRLLTTPGTPYTAALIAAVPRYDRPDSKLAPAAAAGNEPLIEGRGLVVSYPRRGGLFTRASDAMPVLKGVDITIGRGETVGIVGESGSGKSTLGRTLLGLIQPTAGMVWFDGVAVSGRDEDALRPLRRRMQMIFQDPMSSLNPRHTIGRILTEPVLLHGLATSRAEAMRQAQAVLDRVGLPAAMAERYPHEISGGQRQRVGIARAIMLRPDFVLADEIVSGLDVTTQAQVLRLLQELGRELGLALAFISHDLSVIRSICHRVYVLRDGVVEEEGECGALFTAPKAAYTRALIDAIPLPVPDAGWLERGTA